MPLPPKPSSKIVARSKVTKSSRQEQYDLLLPYYAEESERYEALNKRAAAYLSIVGAVSILAAFKPELFSKHVLTHPTLITLALLALIALLMCVLSVGYSLRIAEYRTPISPMRLVLDADAMSYTSDDLYSIMLTGLIQSIESNREQNDLRAKALQTSLWSAAIAVLFAIALNATLLVVASKETSMSNSSESQKPTTSVPAPAPSSPATTSMADLLSRPVTVPLKKSEDFTPQNPPSVKAK